MLSMIESRCWRMPAQNAGPEVQQEEEALRPPLDLSHHLSRVTKSRVKSSMKKFYKYFQIPGIENLAGGLPNAKYFPYDTLEAQVALPGRWAESPNKPTDIDDVSSRFASSSLGGGPSAARVLVPHQSTQTDPLRKIDLTSALQYGTAQGYPALYSFIRQFTREHLHPNVPYLGGPDIVLTCGNTDGFSKVLEAFSNVWSEERDWVREREGILCEEFAYMNAVQNARPRGLQVVPVKMDDVGMLPYGKGGLEDILENWDFRKGKRPHLMYSVTIGQNPTGGLLTIQRRKEIYALLSKYDVLVVEDEPYWYLQFPSAAKHEAEARFTPYDASEYENLYNLPKTAKSSGFEYLDSLSPSYLSIDVDGRVIRLDTFSKTVAPGCRLGWITAQPALIERLLMITETSTQQPSGFVQAMIAELLMGPENKDAAQAKGTALKESGWKMDGWVRWLAGLRGEYERRMNRMCEILEEGRYQLKQSTPVKAADADWAIVSKTEMYSFDWPRAGMFLWLKVTYETHPLYNTVPALELAQSLWVHFTSKPFLVLISPGTMFSPTTEIATTEGYKYFRLCFAAVDDEVIEKASERFVAAVNSFWRIKKKEDLDKIVDDETIMERVKDEPFLNMGLNWMC